MCVFVCGRADEKVDFVMGLRTLAGAGHPSTRAGMGIYIYTANADMLDTAFYNSDGDFLMGTDRHLSCALLLPSMSWRLTRVA